MADKLSFWAKKQIQNNNDPKPFRKMQIPQKMMEEKHCPCCGRVLSEHGHDELTGQSPAYYTCQNPVCQQYGKIII